MICPVVTLGLRGPCAKYLGVGGLSYVDHAKIFRSLPCENVTATCFVCISILTGTNVYI